MAQVPHRQRSRRSHGRAVRPSHSHTGYLPGMLGYEEVYEQIGVDGDVQPGGIPPGTVDGDGALIPGSLSFTPFASTIRPVGIVVTLPILPDPAYPVGALIFLTTDGKLYRNVAGAWTKAVDGADIVADSITAGQIAAGAIGASEIAVGAVSAEKIAADTITAGQIAAGAIGASEIAAGVVSAVHIAANTITAAEIAAGAVTADELAVAAVTAVKIAAGAVGTNELAANAVRVSRTAFGEHRLLDNPDFEIGPFDEVGVATGWVHAGDGFMQVQTDVGAPSGTHRLQLWNDAAAGESNASQGPIPCASGDVFVLSTKARSDGSATMFLRLSWEDSAHGFISVSDQSFTVPSAWARYTAKLGPAPATAKFLKVYLLNTTESANCYFDDVWFTKATDLVIADGNVLIDSSGITVNNGKITVKNPAATVIIDGTSNMFKIAATGTLSVPAQGGGSTPATATVDLATGLTFNPASLFYVLSTYALILPHKVLAHGDGTWLDEYAAGAKVVNTNQTQVQGTSRSRRVGGIPAVTYRYYVLKEATI